MMLWALVAVAQAHDSVAWRVDQARQFAKRGWWDDAAAELAAAQALEGARDSFPLQWLGAQVSYERCAVDDAIRYANRAAVLAPDDAARERALELTTTLGTGFGHLRVTGPRAGLTVALRVERETPQLDPELTRLTTQCAARWRRGIDLPANLSLPLGGYTVNGSAVAVAVSTDAHVDLHGAAVTAAGLARTGVSAGGGLALLVGERVGRVAPTGYVGVGVDVPVGVIDLGLGARWAPETWTVGTGESASSFLTFGAWVRVGHRFGFADAFVFTPGIGVAWDQVPGVAWACSADGTCATPDGDAVAVELHPVSSAWTPHVALALDWSSPGRKVRPELGVDADVGWAFGTAPTEGTATFRDGSGADALPWTLADPAWSALGLHFGAHAGLLF